MFYVDYDGSYVPLDSHNDLPAVIASDRIFATLVGATNHPDAKAHVTPIARIKQVAYYSGKEIIENDWSTDGLEPVDYVTEVKLEDVWADRMNERLHNVNEHIGSILQRRAA